MINLPDKTKQNLTIDEQDFLSKLENEFKHDYTLSIYADIEGYSLIVLGRVRNENNRNYIIYSSQHIGRLYTKVLENELKYLKDYFKSFYDIYCINNSVLKLLVKKTVSSKHQLVDFKLEEISNYLLSIELLIGADKLRIHPIVNEFGVIYQEFNSNIKSYPVYALMLPFIEYNEKSFCWVAVTLYDE